MALKDDVEGPGWDIEPYDGRRYTTAEDAAKAFHKHLRRLFDVGGPYAGWKFDVETFCKSPEQSIAHSSYKDCQDFEIVRHWWVCFEAGPHCWAVGTSMVNAYSAIEPTVDNLLVRCIPGPWGFCETFWGFDLVFIDEPQVAHRGQVQEEA